MSDIDLKFAPIRLPSAELESYSSGLPFEPDAQAVFDFNLTDAAEQLGQLFQVHTDNITALPGVDFFAVSENQVNALDFFERNRILFELTGSTEKSRDKAKADSDQSGFNRQADVSNSTEVAGNDPAQSSENPAGTLIEAKANSNNNGFSVMNNNPLPASILENSLSPNNSNPADTITADGEELPTLLGYPYPESIQKYLS